MPDEDGQRRVSGQLEAMFAQFAEEQRKLEEFHRKLDEASTTVESANKMLTATFDGRGEVSRLTFNNTKYRTMAPNELAEMVLDVIRRGRSQAFGKIDTMAGGEVLPGVNFGDLAAGKANLNEVVSGLMTSAIDLPGIFRAADSKGNGDG
ncbi:YbaB/EbfC family nucleoid-associated protein [Phytohabitans kaempferiae]|uniref:YbaB/EbfC family nucleoid-associated protein n=1 Tax=Phytohabitans kaempferiae TaxID=1620943 RepID=A0ABV6M8U1_9ACTN